MTPRAMIEVWVCARPGARHLDAALASVRAAGAAPHVVTAAHGMGPAIARNDALAHCQSAVLALIDDDVEVSADWLDALRAVWSAPEADELGCAGGPLHARFSGARPAWLGDALLQTLGVDPGPPNVGSAAPVLVDAAERTFSGGNVSFRAAALRGVGGFWPARGAPGLRDWFGEEHRAQHDLAAAGWNATWVPGAVAQRCIDTAEARPANVLRLRALSGARAGSVGTPSRPAVTARIAAKAAVGTPVALVRHDPAKAVERAARAVQNAGVLTGPMIGHRSLQPAAARTPFEYSIAPAAPGPIRKVVPRTVRRLRRCAPLVLAYHRVGASRWDPLGLRVSPQHFAEQLEVLVTRRSPVPLEEIVAGDAPRDGVAVTLDDGYADAVQAALPALEAAGVPATFFISTGHVGSGRAFWWDAAEGMLRCAPGDAGPLELTINGETRIWPARDARERELAFLCLSRWLHAQRSELIDGALRAIARWSGVEDPFVPPAEDRPMTVSELRRLAVAPGVTIGSHGVGHASLASLPADRRADELRTARDTLDRWLGSPPAGVAYPYGVPDVDVDAATQADARNAGYLYGVVNASRRWGRNLDPMALPRAAVGDTGADSFDAWLRQA
jgi:peptidoglycan/xylan/chitin deacetylase (PgdA/CDA1 family)